MSGKFVFARSSVDARKGDCFWRMTRKGPPGGGINHGNGGAR
jgi:hypothetical protein